MSGGRRGIRGLVRPALATLAACLIAVLLFDVLAWFFAPASLTGFAPSYRLSQTDRLDMEGYYRADPVMGFDIAPSQSGRHRQRVAGVGKVAAASNDLGCRDPRNLADLRQLRGYTYFAGDSFTWGYVPAARTFPRAYERASGNPALNCGVGATGQWQQLEKFRRTVAAIGQHPRQAVVARFQNDPAEDNWPTGRTVVLGLTVNSMEAVALPVPAGLRLAGRAAEARPTMRWRYIDPQVLERQVRKHRAWKSSRIHWGNRMLLQHSLFYQMLYHAAHAIRAPADPRPIPAASAPPHFLQDPHTRSHRAAIKAWRDDARKHGYQLTFVLLPHRGYLGNPPPAHEWAQVMHYLDTLGIPYLDFAGYARAKKLQVASLWHRHDAHLSEDGNRILGEWLAEQLP